MLRNVQCLTVPSLWIHAVRNAKLHQHRGAKVEVMTFGGAPGYKPRSLKPNIMPGPQKANLGNSQLISYQTPETNIFGFGEGDFVTCLPWDSSPSNHHLGGICLELFPFASNKQILDIDHANDEFLDIRIFLLASNINGCFWFP